MVTLLLAIIYMAFISLGLPDGLLGAAWPVMQQDLAVPESYAGIVSMIIAACSILSSLLSDKVTRRLGAGPVTAVSVLLTAAALLGFSLSRSFWMLCALAVPYGLGAGAVDAALNNYVALHYSSRHMSWLHAFWGVGAAIGPYVMSVAIGSRHGWPMGYRVVGLLQVCLTAVLLCSLKLWKAAPTPDTGDGEAAGPLTLGQIFAIPGAKAVMSAFFCYCALESTAGLWASSYLTLHRGVDAQTAAGFASLFYIGITAGRALNGFLTLKFSDTTLIRMGCGMLGVGVAALLLPLGQFAALAGLVLVGIGCAPIYPCIIHSTPDHFGPQRSQALIGVQMASAYTGSLLMPPLFGLIANHITVGLFPVYLLALLIVMAAMHELLCRTAQHS